ncbi:MAG: helix-turn-helix domain-containing protein [Lacrimispora saccharolytica]
MNYTDRMKGLRQDKDLTQKQIANKLGVAQNSYSQYESGIRSIPIELLIELCKMYDVSADYMLGISNIKNRYPKK